MGILPLILLLLATISCTDNNCLVYSFQPVSHDGWRSTDTMQYEIPEIPSNGWYTVFVDIRTGEKFLYRSLYLAIERDMHNPRHFCRDTISYAMALDSVHMDSRGSTLQTFSRPVINLRMQKGQYGTIRVYHLMTREVLPDIHEIGVRIKEKR